MQQNVADPDCLKDILPRFNLRHALRLIRFVAQGIAPGEPVHLHQKCQVNRSGYLKNILLRHFQFIL